MSIRAFQGGKGAAAGVRRRTLAACAVAVVVMAGLVDRTPACPFCFGSLQLTLREQIDVSDVTVIVRWTSGEPGNLAKEIPATTTFEVVEVLRGEPGVGRSFTIDRFQAGKRGDLFLMSANRLGEGDDLQWDRSIPLSQEALAYLRGLPAADASASERLRHALAHLEAADDTVATDAFTVLAASRYEDIASLRTELPREKLQKWVFAGNKLKGQLGVYGMLLGLCGDEGDRRSLERLILDVKGADEFRLGMAGVMGGYLLLAKADGLALLGREFLANPEASSSDHAAVMEALRFMGQYADDRIDRPRLARAVRSILPTTDLPELAIADLARWQDWSSTDMLLDMYESRGRSDRYVRKAIVTFMITASQADRNGLSPKDREALDRAAQFVETLQKDEPALYKQAARTLAPDR